VVCAKIRHDNLIGRNIKIASIKRYEQGSAPRPSTYVCEARGSRRWFNTKTGRSSFPFLHIRGKQLTAKLFIHSFSFFPHKQISSIHLALSLSLSLSHVHSLFPFPIPLYSHQWVTLLPSNPSSLILLLFIALILLLLFLISDSSISLLSFSISSSSLFQITRSHWYHVFIHLISMHLLTLRSVLFSVLVSIALHNCFYLFRIYNIMFHESRANKYDWLDLTFLEKLVIVCLEIRWIQLTQSMNRTFEIYVIDYQAHAY
jgi:hypothetical protein